MLEKKWDCFRFCAVSSFCVFRGHTEQERNTEFGSFWSHSCFFRVVSWFVLKV